MPETLWDGGPLLHQDKRVFPMCTDSVILADFAHPPARGRILDLGTGSGILPILLLHPRPGLTADAADISPDACALAEKNFAANGLCDRARVLQGDLRSHRGLIPAGAYDLTISNPPYFSEGRGYAAAGSMEGARGESALTLGELCAAAAYATRWGGSFCLVYRPERLPELFAALAESGFAPKRIRPVAHDTASAVNLVLIEARRGGKPGLSWEPCLYLREADGSETPEIRRIYHRHQEAQP